MTADPAPLGDVLGAVRFPGPHLGVEVDEWAPPAVEDMDPHDQRRVMRLKAWRRCLVEAHHDAYLDADLADLDDTQSPGAAGRFVDIISDRSAPIRTLILAGRIGAGKTHAAIAIGNRAVADGLSARFVKHSTYLAWLRPDGNPDGVTPNRVREMHRSCDLLVLDDLGAELERDATDFVRGETNDLVGDRLSSGKATIVNTNLTSKRIAELLGERLISRLGSRAFIATFTGPDRRRPVSW